MNTNKELPDLNTLRSGAKWTARLASILPLIAALSLSAQPVKDEPAPLLEKLSASGRNAMEARSSRARALTGSEATPGKTEPIPEVFLYPLGPIGSVFVNDPTADATTKDTQSETTLVMGLGSTLVSAFNDSGSSIGGARHFTGFSVSTDGGATWTDKGTLPTSTEGDAGDPVLAHGLATDPVPPMGSLPDTIYLATLGFFTGEQMQVFRSFDSGQTFTAPVNATPGFVGTGDFMDKEWIAVDNFTGPGQGNVYLAWRQFADSAPGSGIPYGVRFVRSTDGGATWGPNQGDLLAAEGSFNVQGAFVVVAPDHAVYVFWLDQSAGNGTR